MASLQIDYNGIYNSFLQNIAKKRYSSRTIKKGASDDFLSRTYRDFIRQDYRIANSGIKKWRVDALRKDFKIKLKQKISQTNSIIKQKKQDNPNYSAAQQKRFIINASLNLMADFNKILANQYQAIAFIWRGREDLKEAGNPENGIKVDPLSKWHGDHWARNNKLYFYKGSWAIKHGLINIKSRKFKWAIFPDGLPGEPINCRCWAYNIYELYKIPRDILSDKGKAYLGLNNKKIKALKSR